jgi:hypothetical protein
LSIGFQDQPGQHRKVPISKNLSGKKKKKTIGEPQWMHTIGLLILKWLILCYVNFTSIKKRLKVKTKPINVFCLSFCRSGPSVLLLSAFCKHMAYQ